jgi:uncharacterized membrane protein
MSLTAATVPARTAQSHRRLLAGLCVVGLLGLFFIAVAALPYYRLDPAKFDTYWPRRWWLLTHITGGIVALMSGPVQLWLGLTDRRPAVHRQLGVVYMSAILVSSFSAYYLAFHTNISAVFGAGLASLATAWLIATGLAYAAIRRSLIDQHKEWMIRSYVITTAFVTFRALFLVLQSTQLGPDVTTRLEIASWICWALPLVLTEAWLQGKKIFAGSLRATN